MIPFAIDLRERMNVVGDRVRIDDLERLAVWMPMTRGWNQQPF